MQEGRLQPELSVPHCPGAGGVSAGPVGSPGAGGVPAGPAGSPGAGGLFVAPLRYFSHFQWLLRKTQTKPGTRSDVLGQGV